MVSRRCARYLRLRKATWGAKKMPERYADNPDLWRSRAVEARAQAEQMSDPLLRERMLSIAESYEGMAVRAEERLRQRRRAIADAVSIGRQILLVEDDEVFRDATAAMLRSAGYAVQGAPDYRQALEILESDERIDLLITDVVMPDRVNGLALSRMARMRRLGLPVIYISGYDIPGFEHEALGALLRKPISDELLLAEIAKTLSALPA
jgi:CheY-like chemotaxis protein